ncbi:MAG: GNAT family N-acetyltransferase, partial [Clostridia bacterium]|nr:GNAT family N-acetyltransferase [Clostridia bacterium]
MIFKNPTFTDMANLKNLWIEAFGDSDEFYASFLKSGFHASRCRLAEEENEILSALYFFDCLLEDKKIAYIYGVATKKQARNRGIAKKLLIDTHEYLKENGYYGALLVPSEKSLFPFYEKLGYKTATKNNTVTVSDNFSDPSKLKKINGEEYAALRRKYLPRGGVIQENENIEYLETLEELYCSKDFIFAAHIEGDTLYASEFLGDTAQLGNITAAFKVKKGV